MSRPARFRTVGRFDRTGRYVEGTVTIHRDSSVVEVRPLRSRRVYRLPLEAVATWVCQVNIRADDREKRKRKNKRRGR